MAKEAIRKAWAGRSSIILAHRREKTFEAIIEESSAEKMAAPIKEVTSIVSRRVRRSVTITPSFQVVCLTGHIGTAGGTTTAALEAFWLRRSLIINKKAKG